MMKKNLVQELRNAQRANSAVYNPLHWLTPLDYDMLLDAGKRGDWPRLQTLWEYIEERFECLGTVISQRQAALGKLSWDIYQADDSPLAEMQAAELRSRFERIQNLEEAWKWLGMATFRGFAHLLFDGDRLECVEQWFFKRQGRYGAWKLIHKPGDTGQDLPPGSYICRECPRPVNNPAGLRYIYSKLAEQDYASGVQDAGILWAFLVGPPGMTEPQQTSFDDSAALALAGQRGSFPHGTEFLTGGASNGGTLNLYESFLKHQEEKVVMLGTGGKLRALEGPGGLGDGGASVQDAVFDDLAIAEAAEISQILQRAIGDPFLTATFPGAKKLAWFAISAKDKEDLKAEADLAESVGRSTGRKVKAAWATEKFGVEFDEATDTTALPATPASKPTPPTVSLNRSPASALLEEMINSLPADQAQRDRIAELLGGEITAEILPPLQALMDGMEPELATALEELIANAIANS